MKNWIRWSFCTINFKLRLLENCWKLDTDLLFRFLEKKTTFTENLNFHWKFADWTVENHSKNSNFSFQRIFLIKLRKFTLVLHFSVSKPSKTEKIKKTTWQNPGFSAFSFKNLVENSALSDKLFLFLFDDSQIIAQKNANVT